MKDVWLCQVGQKVSLVFFCQMLWKNMNEPFGQPKTSFRSILFLETSLL